MSLTLVLGIGNALLSDESAGIQAVRHLESHLPPSPDLALIDGGTLSFTLAADIERADRLIVIDAARLDAAPGTVRCFENEAMDRFVGRGRLSVHEVGLADLLDITRLAGNLPAPRALIGIQPASMDWGLELTDAVAAALPEVARNVVSLLQRWDAADCEESAA